MRLSPGTRLGTYEVLGPLGAGGMGDVYRAKDLRLGREVAVKVLPEAVASSPDRLARFEREARTVAGLNHPNIVTLFSVEDEDGIRFLTMELVEGQGLANVIAPGGLPLSRVLELCIPVADALVAAHERGVIHRDLKPGNVMVTREGRIKVLDFGLAKVVHSRAGPDGETVTVMADASDSVAGQVMGTVPYMAPEQLCGDSADPRTDLFALGIILYELATGRRPFTGATSAEVISSILRDTPEPLTRARADLPGDLERIVSRCLEKNPRERAQSALDVANELRRLRRESERDAERQPSEKVASIAVLPFVNRSASAEDEYFSDGLADELLNVLAKIKGLRVCARTSSFQFKTTKDDLPTIGRKLNVATLLEGSVRKAGSRVRIWVQLVNASDGYHLWSETYDRTLEDIFAVQDDIAHSVVKELRTTLLGEKADASASGKAKAEVARAATGRGMDPEAHRLYFQGRYFVDRLTRDDTRRGIQYLKAAIVLDASFALAWAELSRAYMRQVDSRWATPTAGATRARGALERALALEPDLAEAYASKGWIQSICDWDWHGASASFHRALHLAPGTAAALRGAGQMALRLGRLDESIAMLRAAVEQDPLNALAHSNLGQAYYFAGRLKETEASYRRAVDLAPPMLRPHVSLALALSAQGRDEEAMSHVKRARSEKGRLYALAQIHYIAGRIQEADEAFRKIVKSHATSMPFHMASLHAMRKEVHDAFEWLERAYAQHDEGLCIMKVHPLLCTLHGDPRWVPFLKRMRLE